MAAKEAIIETGMASAEIIVERTFHKNRNTRSQRFERIFDQLDLSDAQKTDVQKIVGETREEIQTLKKDCDAHVQEIRAHSDERFKEIFSNEQYGKFVNLRDELRQSRKSGNGN